MEIKMVDSGTRVQQFYHLVKYSGIRSNRVSAQSKEEVMQYFRLLSHIGQFLFSSVEYILIFIAVGWVEGTKQILNLLWFPDFLLFVHRYAYAVASALHGVKNILYTDFMIQVCCFKLLFVSYPLEIWMLNATEIVAITLYFEIYRFPEFLIPIIDMHCYIKLIWMKKQAGNCILTFEIAIVDTAIALG